ncbi:hypothetical protein HELRODRAFT_105309 [Helobdella robusta]|uniref:C2H2-type domain-containing protein n=1 Tax=Helobdella robusta TaxID=6412 RepID=T1EDT7_HELRO|nr:hypothetical protein HELRODRAFT_105309 [Helobdella robusta]ESO12398.1 hypothetical protein HELRODRAFT_105309 [Helobdella robusta]
MQNISMNGGKDGHDKCSFKTFSSEDTEDGNKNGLYRDLHHYSPELASKPASLVHPKPVIFTQFNYGETSRPPPNFTHQVHISSKDIRHSYDTNLSLNALSRSTMAQFNEVTSWQPNSAFEQLMKQNINKYATTSNCTSLHSSACMKIGLPNNKGKVNSTTAKISCDCPNCKVVKNEGMSEGKDACTHNCHIPGCGKVYSKISHLKAHLHWHSDDRLFVCNQQLCGKTYTRSVELQKHLKDHSNLHNDKKSIKLKSTE